MAMASSHELLDAKAVAEELLIPFAQLQRMARRGEYPELLNVTRGVYRVRKTDHQAWMQSRWTRAQMASDELEAERMRAALGG